MINYDGVLCIDEATFLRLPVIDTSVPLTVYGVGERIKAVVDKLYKLYGDVEVCADDKTVRLSDIEHAERISPPAQPDFDKKRYNAVDAIRVMNRLMQKEGGCPWDSVQTHESIRVNLIEEAYEAVDAIDTHDLNGMREEFGDVLLQSLLQSAIARRDGEFDFDDVCDELCKKLISRHTFIFGDDNAAGAGDAITLWDKNKAKEKNYASVKDQLQRLPEEFPSLLRCQKAYKKIKKSGAPTDMFELGSKIENGDYAAAIAALTAKLSDEGKDAEVELNRVVRDIVKGLPGDK